MRNKIFGGIGMLWGGGILVRWFMVGTSGSGAYQTGQNGAVILGILMFIAGAYYFFIKES